MIQTQERGNKSMKNVNKTNLLDLGSTAVKCGRHQMSEIMGEIRGTPKNVIHR